MIDLSNLLKSLKKKNVSFFCGVPDSILKSLSIYLNKQNKKKHIISTNEGSAVSLAIGYHLATNKIPCVYLQNSGLGNAINPLISLAHKKVYSIPMLLLIGWRGSPNSNDEPQHMVKGKITPNILKLLGIKYFILRNEQELNKLEKLISYSKRKNEPVACLIEKNIIRPIKYKANTINKNLLFRKEFIKEFLKLIPSKSKIISTTGYTSRELFQIRKDNKIKKAKDFYMVGGMGHASIVSLGFSLNSNKQIFCLDGDGSLLMHMGALRTIGNFSNKNFKHILFNNNAHESVGNQATTSDKIKFDKLVNGLGYKKYFIIKKNNNYKSIIKKFIKSSGPSFLEVKTSVGSLKNLIRPKNLINVKKNFKSK